MSTETRLGRGVEITNKIVQTIAILVAGVWAIWTWSQATAPSLKTGLFLSGNVQSFAWNQASNSCLGYVRVVIENAGQRNIVVERVEYELFAAKPVKLEPNEKAKVPESVPKVAELLQKGTLPFLAGAYAPKVNHDWNVAVLLGREVPKDLWFKAEAFDQHNQSLDFWYGAIDPCASEQQATVQHQ